MTLDQLDERLALITINEQQRRQPPAGLLRTQRLHHLNQELEVVAWREHL